jgi:hypothetical protein
MVEAALLSLVTASIAFTISETELFAPLREWGRARSSRVGKLLGCGYCIGFWTAFGLVAIYRPRVYNHWWLLDYLLTAFLIAWLSAFQWASLCWLMDRTGK